VNTTKKIGLALSTAVVSVMPFLAMAQVPAYSSQSATTTSIFNSIAADLSTTLLVVVVAVISLAVLLVGIGYGWRKLKSKVFGKAF